MKTAAFSAAELRFGAGYPGPRICRTFTRKGAAVSSQGLPEIRSPLGAAPKPAAPPGLLHGEVAKPTGPPGLLHGEARKPTAPPGLLHGEVRKPTAPPGLLHGEARKPTTAVAFARAGFSGRAAGRNGALPYNARKSQFLRNGDVWATESLFLFAVLWLAFLPGQSETGVAGGGKARRPETPAAPRRPAQRPRPAPGFCAASANARPGDPAPVRLLEKALWVPPTTEPFRPAPSGKPERKKERRNPG